MTRKPAAAIDSHDLRIRVIAAMSEIAAADWDRCAGGGATIGGPAEAHTYRFGWC